MMRLLATLRSWTCQKCGATVPDIMSKCPACGKPR